MAKTTKWADSTIAQIFELSYVDSMSSLQIEAILGVPSRTVRGILSNEANQKKYRYLLENSVIGNSQLLLVDGCIQCAADFG